jgi:hypothetical protein
MLQFSALLASVLECRKSKLLRVRAFRNVSRIDGIRVNLFSTAMWVVQLLSEIQEEDSLDVNFYSS